MMVVCVDTNRALKPARGESTGFECPPVSDGRFRCASLELMLLFPTKSPCSYQGKRTLCETSLPGFFCAV